MMPKQILKHAPSNRSHQFKLQEVWQGNVYCPINIAARVPTFCWERQTLRGRVAGWPSESCQWASVGSMTLSDKMIDFTYFGLVWWPHCLWLGWFYRQRLQKRVLQKSYCMYDLFTSRQFADTFSYTVIHCHLSFIGWHTTIQIHPCLLPWNVVREKWSSIFPMIALREI